MLSGERATRSAFIERAPAFDVLHISSHAVSSDDPLGVRIVMAASPGEPSALAARDILDLDLRGVELVVLSSCGSAAGPVVGDAGVQSLARAFLAAGARFVVATPWPVDDVKAGEVMVGLYVELEKHPTIPAGFRAWRQAGSVDESGALDPRMSFELYSTD